MRNTFPKVVLPFLIEIFVVLSQSTLFSAALITDVRFWSAPDHTRVVLDLTEPIQYESSSQVSPAQFHLEMKETILLTRKRELGVNDSFLSRISLTPLGEKKVQLILHQKRPLQASILTLKAYQDKPHRLVIDLIDPAQEKKVQEERQKQKETSPKGTRIVAIDPGQGGGAPGAKASQGTRGKKGGLRGGE